MSSSQPVLLRRRSTIEEGEMVDENQRAATRRGEGSRKAHEASGEGGGAHRKRPCSSNESSRRHNDGNKKGRYDEQAYHRRHHRNNDFRYHHDNHRHESGRRCGEGREPFDRRDYREGSSRNHDRWDDRPRHSRNGRSQPWQYQERYPGRHQNHVRGRSRDRDEASQRYWRNRDDSSRSRSMSQARSVTSDSTPQTPLSTCSNGKTHRRDRSWSSSRNHTPHGRGNRANGGTGVSSRPSEASQIQLAEANLVDRLPKVPDIVGTTTTSGSKSRVKAFKERWVPPVKRKIPLTTITTKEVQNQKPVTPLNPEPEEFEEKHEARIKKLQDLPTPELTEASTEGDASITTLASPIPRVSNDSSTIVISESPYSSFEFDECEEEEKKATVLQEETTPKRKSAGCTETAPGRPRISGVGSDISDDDDDADSSDDSDTDDEELALWAHTMMGALPPALQKQQLDAFLATEAESDSELEEPIIRIKEKKMKKKRSKLSKLAKMRKPTMSEEERRQELRRKKEEARAPTAAELRVILGDDNEAVGPTMNWVRRSVRQPSKAALESGKLRELVYKLKVNDSDMVVLKMKKYINNPDTPQVVIDAALDAMEENTNCEALYIQNFNKGMRDKQLIHLLRVLQLPSCKIWCLNVGETYNVKMSTWRKFARGLEKTNVTHMYASEHTITPELKDQIRDTIRTNRKKHKRHIDPTNLSVIIQCTHCWWNPANAKVLRPFLRNEGYEHLLMDKEAQGLRGSRSAAPTGISPMR